MPVKRRAVKGRRRMSEAEELAAWDTLFRDGFDFFGETGLPNDAAAREAACEVWPRLGTAFLTAYEANPGVSPPWALLEFGEPPCR
jgi:hypothetical protein